MTIAAIIRLPFFLCLSFSCYSSMESVYPSRTRYTFYIQTLCLATKTIKRSAGWVCLLKASPGWARSLSPAHVLPMNAHLQVPLTGSLSQRPNGFSTALSLPHLEENYDVKVSEDQPLEMFYPDLTVIAFFKIMGIFASYRLVFVEGLSLLFEHHFYK